MLAGDLTGAKKLLAQAAVAGSRDPKITNNTEVLASLKPSAPAALQKPVAAGPKSPAVTTLSSTSPDRTAIAPPKPLTSAVVMQAVPADPLAGPVKPKALPAAKLASSSKPKPASTAAAPSAPPALRTAAEAN
jgi:hypothetical protein